MFKTLIVMFYVAVWEEAPHNDASSCLWECFRRLKNDGSEQFEQTGPRRDLLTCSRRMCRRWRLVLLLQLLLCYALGMWMIMRMMLVLLLGFVVFWYSLKYIVTVNLLCDRWSGQVKFMATAWCCGWCQWHFIEIWFRCLIVVNNISADRVAATSGCVTSLLLLLLLLMLLLVVLFTY